MVTHFVLLKSIRVVMSQSHKERLRNVTELLLLMTVGKCCCTCGCTIWLCIAEHSKHFWMTAACLVILRKKRGKNYMSIQQVKNWLGLLHNSITTGILAGVWPCGVITLLGKLYQTESKSQVFGCLHNYFYSNKNTSIIGKLTIDNDHNSTSVILVIHRYFVLWRWLSLKKVCTKNSKSFFD